MIFLKLKKHYCRHGLQCDKAFIAYNALLKYPKEQKQADNKFYSLKHFFNFKQKFSLFNGINKLMKNQWSHTC